MFLKGGTKRRIMSMPVAGIHLCRLWVPYPSFGFNSQMQDDGEKSYCGDGSSPGEDIHL